MMQKPDMIIIGGGLAGSEAAWQAAQQGFHVGLYEMRPKQSTGAHRTGALAELVCSNSLGSSQADHAAGLLKNELRRLGSVLLECAESAAIPAGSALAVDREGFSALVTQRLNSHDRITIHRQEVTSLPSGPVIVASGPLTSPRLSEALSAFTGKDHLYFFDAISPIVSADSINMDIAYRASRYDQGQQDAGDYINCPFTREQYDSFVNELVTAGRTELHSVDGSPGLGSNTHPQRFFEACLPVEILGLRSRQALSFGPMRPTGLTDPRTGRWPHALVQLRQDNLARSLYNMVGFQTNLTYPEQRRVFRKVPGLENAEFVRYGQMHRNTYIAAPLLLHPSLQSRQRPDLFFAGQITGAEGYIGNIATGLLAGLNLSRLLKGLPLLCLPVSTLLGALCSYLANADPESFQPVKANFGLLPGLDADPRMSKPERARRLAQRAQQDLEAYLALTGFE